MYSSHYLPDTLIPSKRQEFISSAKELLARFSTPPVLLSTGLSGISLAAPLQQHLHTYLGIDCPLMYIRDPHTKTIAHGSKVEYSARLDMRPDHLLLVDDIVSSGTTLENTLRTIY
jgi:hypoxanthine phosphoribosyltransferase